jgi:outer membrane protein OmpA-like peptidoglycan-associated protein
MKFHAHNLSFLLIVLVLAIGTSSQLAHAQEGEGLTLDTFTPTSSTESFFELVLPKPKKELEWSVGGLIHYAHEPVQRRVTNSETNEIQETTYPLKLRLTVELYASVGLWKYIEIGLVVPIIAYQSGDGTVPGESIQNAGIGDPRLEIKGQFLDTSGFSMGARLAITAPIGHYASSGTDFMGSPLPTFEPQLLTAYTNGRVIAALNVGFLIRQSQTVGDYEQQSALTWNAGVGYDVFDFYKPHGLRIAAEMNGQAGINFDSLVETPMEILLGAKYRTRNDLIISAGAGPGSSSAVGTPSFRVFIGIAYDPITDSCPAGSEDYDGYKDDDNCIDPDNDADGVLDEDDDCPNEPEDMDRFKDEDGCPDWDNDADTFRDDIDKCPMIPEDFDNFEDEDGCPEEGPGKASVKITDTQLLISSKVYYDYDKATIKEVSYPILDAVAEALNNNPGIQRVQIEGHSDNEGTEAYNQKLSEDRAKAVRKYLINKNVAPERLMYKGYGFSRPKASNRTEEGKAINRRVEFTIVDKD